jgi:capsular polysaccharide biosynthesis protein
MTDWEASAAAHLNGGDSALGRLAAADNFSADNFSADNFRADDGWPAASGMGLVSLGFLKAAIRRSAAFICVMTVVGFIVGVGADKAFPAPYHASTTLVLTDGPYEDGINSAQDDQNLIQTSNVAVLAMRKLGVRQSVSSFLKAYEMTVESPRVLLVTFGAKSASQAVRGANAVAAAFLQFRASMLEEQQEEVFAAQQQQVGVAQQQVSSIDAQISEVSAEPASSAHRAQLSGLRAQRTNATENLAVIQQGVSADKVTVQPATAAAIKGSKALDAATPLPRSRVKSVLLYPLAGLIAGLALAIALVVIRAIVSDRPRRRGDVADALEAPVVLSTGPLRTGRWLSPARLWPGRAAARRADIDRVVRQLGRALRQRDRSTAVLAVVAVNDPETAALPVVALARSWAAQGMRVVVADLASGAPAARLLGFGSPGVRAAKTDVAVVVVAVPDQDDATPCGPLGHTQSPRDQDPAFSDAVATAHSGADLLLTLVTLDPSFGAEHLRTWADDAVVIVTAGRSSWTRINAVGELIRLSGTRLLSAILVGADRSDDSLGVTSAHPLDHAPGIVVRKGEATTRSDVMEEPALSDRTLRMHVIDDARLGQGAASRDEPRA